MSCNRTCSSVVATVLAGIAPLAIGAQDSSPPQVITMPEDLGGGTLEARRQAQLATIDRFDTFFFFRFSDRLAESGIDFRHRVVDDAGKAYKADHYDHGNGVAVADVDGDGLYDLYFVTQVGSNELWKNSGGGRFTNITAPAGVGVDDRISVTASFADIDNDGDPDLFVTTVKMGNLLFENLGEGRFRDITAAAGVEYTGHSSAASFFDYDRDGLVDLFLTNVGIYTGDTTGADGYYVGFHDAFSGHLYPPRTETSILYKNLGGKRFLDTSEATGLVDGSWSGDSSPTDLNRDGYPDLYVLNMQGDDHYYENTGGRFQDRTARFFPRTPWGSMGIKFFDYNNDGRTDLMLTDMHSDMSQQVGLEAEKLKSDMQWTDQYLAGGDNNIFGNAFFENRGDTFREVSDLIGAENYWPWGISVADLNADGFEDVFVASSMSYPWRYGVNTVLLNDRGRYLHDSEFILGIEPRSGGATKTPWFEVDCSGPGSEHRACEGVEGPIEVRGALGTRSTVIFDLDGDGDLDIVTNEFHARPQILVSDLSARGQLRYLQIRLVGRESNRDGLGATVRIHTGEAVYTRYHDGKSGYLAQSSMPVYVGLGKATAVEKLEVLWPSGRTQTVTGIELNSTLEIVEETPAPEDDSR